MYNKNNNSNNKITTYKTFLMLSISILMLMTYTIVNFQYAQAEAGDILLTINNPAPNVQDEFGHSVAGTSNGNILVGAYFDDTGINNAGSAYLFEGTTGSLLLTINNPAPNRDDYFGRSVASTIDGNILVGGEHADFVYLFDGTLRGHTNTPLLTINSPASSSSHFGHSVAGTTDGNILVGAHGDDTGADAAGSAYLFDGTDGSLLLTINNPTPEEGDIFGYSVAGTTDGNILVGATNDDTGADYAGSAYLFDGTDGSLLLTINNPTPEFGDGFGISVAGTTNGNILVGAKEDNFGAENAGSAYLFDGTDGSLLLTINNPIPDANDYFGYSVAGTTNGNILVGTFSTESAYLFDSTDGSLLLTINSPTSGDRFGNSVASTIDGNILVGASYDNTGANNAGSAYLFEGILSIQPGSSLWTQNGNDIYYNTGNVGIGTTTPNAKLQIHGTSDGPSSTGLLLTRDGDAPYMRFQGSNGRIAEIQWDGWLLNIQDGKSGPLSQIKLNGWVGIGTAPQAKLDISGIGFFYRFGEDAYLNDKIQGLHIRSTDTSWNPKPLNLIESYGSSITNRDNTVLQLHTDETGSSATVLNVTSGNSAVSASKVILTAQANGKVGIGVNTPWSTLHVKGGQADPNNPDVSQFVISDEYGTYTIYGQRSDYSFIETHQSKPLILNPLGNSVGIGKVTNPRSLVDIRGTTGGVQDGNQILTVSVDGSTDYLGFGIDADERYSWIRSVRAGIGENDLILNPVGGNVGIGITDPSEKLHVMEQDVNSYTGFRLENPGQSNMELRTYGDSSSVWTGASIITSWNTDVDLGLVADSLTKVNDGTSDHVIWLDASSGNVGIGTTTPKNDVKLDVAGNIGLHGNIIATAGQDICIGNCPS